jgi:hypothetical protein
LALHLTKRRAGSPRPLLIDYALASLASARLVLAGLISLTRRVRIIAFLDVITRDAIVLGNAIALTLALLFLLAFVSLHATALLTVTLLPAVLSLLPATRLIRSLLLATALVRFLLLVWTLLVVAQLSALVLILSTH